MNVKDWIDLITEVGVLVVIAGIFLYTAIRVINIFLGGLENKLKERKHDKLLDIRNEVSIQIQSLLDDFLEDHQGTRIMVMEFSNSVTSVAYLPFKYMSCTYEVYQMGRQAKAHRVDRLSTSLFTRFFNTMLDRKFYIFNDETDIAAIGGSVFDIMKDLGEHRFICSMLKTANGKNIGFLCMNKDEEFEESDVDGIQSLAAQISALLGVVDN